VKYVKEGSVKGQPLHWGPVEETLGGFISPGTLIDRRRALETERLFLWELCKGNLEGGSFTGDPEEYVKVGSTNRQLSPLGARWRTWRGVRLRENLTDS